MSRIYKIAIATLTLCIVLNLACSAQNFKVGDRVEARPYGSAWNTATVMKILMNNGNVAGIVVRMDNEKDDAGNRREYVTSAYNIRMSNAAPANTQAQETKQIEAENRFIKLRVDGNNTVLADRPLLNCNALQIQGKTGNKPDAQLITKLIRCIWEKPADRGSDGATTIDVAPLQMGQPRRWIVNMDEGNDGNASTIIYPVKTTYTMRVFYRTRISEQQFTGLFYCYVNTFGQWRVENHDSRAKGKEKEIPVR